MFFIRTTREMFFTSLALAGIVLLSGCGDANRSPFAPDQTAIVSSDSQAPVSVTKPAKAQEEPVQEETKKKTKKVQSKSRPGEVDVDDEGWGPE